MSTQKTRQRIRIAFGTTPFASEKDLITNALAKSWRGADVQIEAAIFSGATLIDDIANIQTLILTVSGGGAGLSSAPLLQLEADAVVLNAALAANDWSAGAEADCHFVFELTKDNMQFDFNGATNAQRELRLTLHGVTTDVVPRYITYGYATWSVVEDGVQNGLDVVGIASRTARVGTNGNLQVLNPSTAAWHDIIPEVVDGILIMSVDQNPI